MQFHLERVHNEATWIQKFTKGNNFLRNYKLKPHETPDETFLAKLEAQTYEWPLLTVLHTQQSETLSIPPKYLPIFILTECIIRKALSTFKATGE